MARQQVTRAEIIQAAWTLATQGGPAEVTMRRVADEAGVAAMTLYNHVDGRDDVLAAIADRFWATVNDLVDTPHPGDEPGPAALADWLHRLAEEVAALGSRVPAVAALAAGRPHGPAIDTLREAFIEHGGDAVPATRLPALWHAALSVLIGHLQLLGDVASDTAAGSPTGTELVEAVRSDDPDARLPTALRWLLEGSAG